jgi:hypothetical protein
MNLLAKCHPRNIDRMNHYITDLTAGMNTALMTLRIEWVEYMEVCSARALIAPS